MENSTHMHLTILGRDGRHALCRCDCGVEKRIRIDHLKSGAVISCGCIGKKNSALAKIKHGMSNTRVFKIWAGILDRCKNDRSGNYGKRGIQVCERWNTFENFYDDMGNPPTNKHSIDRIDVNGNYEPGNCRWATPQEQNTNKRNNTILLLNGERKTISEWSKSTGIKPSTICVRLYALGWSVEKALTVPAKQMQGNKPWIDLGMSRTTYYRKRGNC